MDKYSNFLFKNISKNPQKKILKTVMGSCLGHCHLVRESFSLYKFYSKANDTVDIQINELSKPASEEHILDNSLILHETDFNNDDSKTEYESRKFNFERLKSIFSNIRKKNDNNSVLRLELLEEEWSLTEGDYSGRTESLILQSSAKIRKEKNHHSPSMNSLDLEWEHLPEMAVFSSNAVEKEEPNSATSAGAWSRLSSADSLEWDSVEVEMKEEIDTETEQLIQEIEMLSLKTLQETQEWAS